MSISVYGSLNYMSTSDPKIIINVDSIWLYENLKTNVNQVFVFEGNKTLKLINLFEDIGMVEKRWTPNVGPSAVVNKIFSWKITDNFKHIVFIYQGYIERMNISLYYENNIIALDSHGLSSHGFRWKTSDIDLDGETTWQIEDRTVLTSCDFDWRDLNLVLNAASYCTTATVKLNSENNDVLWEGYDEDDVKCWAHQHQRLAWKFGEASSKFRPDILLKMLDNMDRPSSYGTNTKFSILKNKILMIETNSTIGYLSPIVDEDVQMEGGLNISDDEPVTN